MRQNAIRDGIEECRRELTTCTDRFSVALSLIKNSESQEREMARQRGHQQLVDMIAVLLEEVRKIGQFKTSELPQLCELLQTQVVEVDGQGGVPQVASSPRSKSDHSGRISRVSEDAVIEGSQLDFYIGEWTNDGERTALGRLRDQSPDSQKRFKEWIEASLSLQHRNILNFFGHVTIDDAVYSVNPLMENGNMRQYIQRNLDADRLRLLREVASGMEFLHESEIVHGDLCDKNVLINRNGKAIVCGFDLFKFSNLAEPRTRWVSPERFTPAGVTSPTEKADIWSFGLLCLEVFTGKDPYHSYSDHYVSYLLIKGTQPEHPGDAAVQVGLSQKMWDLMQSCWQCDTAQRPSMSEIQSMIRDMLPLRDPHQQPTGIMDLPVLIPFTPTIEAAPSNEATRTSSPLSPLTSPTLVEISPVLQEANILAPTAFPRTVDQQPTRNPQSGGERATLLHSRTDVSHLS
ncbi:kinase-like domain-containing protein [Russula vinacea]|nr:kinase-like domain-containing protein [Russula vinacea]